ncbi:Protein F46F2.5 [Aphelenchoides avenae]|nr:Protein F46F2.5 [Aphelenchus avenae]
MSTPLRIFAITCRRCWGGRLLPLEPAQPSAPQSPSRRRIPPAPPLATAATTRWWTPLHRPTEDVYRPRDADDGEAEAIVAPPLVVGADVALPPAVRRDHYMQLPLGMGKTCSKSSKSAIVRARYVPDVKGVNRPLTNSVSPVPHGESIDAKRSRSPRSPRSTELPHIDIASVASQRKLSKSGEETSPTLEHRDVFENNLRSNRSTTALGLHQLSPSPTSPTAKTETTFSASTGNLPSISGEKIVPKRNASFNRLNGYVGHQPLVIPNSRRFSQKQTEPTAIETMPATTPSLPKAKGATPRVVRSNSISAVRRRGSELCVCTPASQRLGPLPKGANLKSLSDRNINALDAAITPLSVEILPATPASSKDTNEFGVQTEPNRRMAFSEYQGSSESTEFSTSSERIPKATQTVRHKYIEKILPLSVDNINELEQRSELLDLIDSALGETIDKESRLLANQFIASSARKQAEVWRDAKEFVSMVLLPQSVAMANQARYVKSPIDAIAKYQLP